MIKNGGNQRKAYSIKTSSNILKSKQSPVLQRFTVKIKTWGNLCNYFLKMMEYISVTVSSC